MSGHRPVRAGHVRGGPSRDTLLDVRVMFAPALPVVRLHGDLRTANVHLVQDALYAVASTRATGPVIVLDLGGVTRCDLAALRAIGELAPSLESAGKVLLVQGTPDCILALVTPDLPPEDWLTGLLR